MMKNTGLFATVLILTLSSVPVQASTILDGYIGGNNHGYGDVIGSASNFQIHQMDVEINGTILTVSIDTTFAGKGDDGLFSGYTFGNTGIGYGDLFLSNSWNPHGAPNYENDDADNGTVWSHGFSLDDRFMNESEAGTGVLYGLNGSDNQSNIKMSDEFLSSGYFRNNQEVAVDRDSFTTTALENAGGWNVIDDKVVFEIDLDGTGLLNGSELALRWEFTCANDVIEGRHPINHVPEVPVPAAAWLFGSGLIGLVAVGRRKNG